MANGGIETGRARRARAVAIVAVASLVAAGGVVGVGAGPAGAGTPSTTRVGGSGNGAAHGVAMTPDGRYVAFVSAASNLVTGDTNGFADVFRWDRQTGTTVLVSVSSSGTQANNASGSLSDSTLALTADGCQVAFDSQATNLTTDLDLNGQSDVFVRDVCTSATTRVSIRNDQLLTVGEAASPAMSTDGRYVAFRYDGNDLPVLGADTNGVSDIYLRDRQTGTTTRISVGTGGTQANGASVRPSMSADGGLVAFVSAASNLVAGDTNAASDVFVRDTAAGATERASVAPGGGQVAGPSDAARLSATGRYVAFRSGGNAFLHDRSTQVTDPAGSGTPRDVTSDGRSVLLTTPGGDLVVHVMTAGTDEQIDVNAGGTGSAGSSSEADPLAPFAISPGGSYVAFDTPKALVSGVPSGQSQVYFRDRALPARAADLTYTITPASVAPGATAVPIASIPPSLVPLPGNSIGAAPLQSIGVLTSPLQSNPLQTIPLQSIPLQSIAVSGQAFGAIPLQSIPLTNGRTWLQLLAGTIYQGVPLQSVTLQQVRALNPVPAEIVALRLGDIDIRNSPLQSISLVSIAMGATPLRSIPVRDGLTSDTARYNAWCDLLATVNVSCSAAGITADSTILTLDLLGVPLQTIPLQSIAIRDLNLTSSPLQSIPLQSILVQADAALRAVPLQSIAATYLAKAFDCTKVDCGPNSTATIADAVAAGAVRAGAVLGDLAAGLPASITLADILMSLLIATDYPWETLDTDAVARAVPGTTATFALGFLLEGDGPAGPLSIAVDLPDGFRFKAGSAAVTAAGAAVPNTADPTTISGARLTWTLDGAVPRNTRVSLTFAAYPGQVTGSFASLATVTAEVAAAATAGVTVSGGLEPNDDPATAPVISPDVLYYTHISSAADIDYFRLPVPSNPGTTMSVTLSHMDIDADLVLYGPTNVPMLGAAPLRTIPLQSNPVSDSGSDSRSVGDRQAPNTVQDVPLQSNPLRSIAAQRSTATERVETRSVEGETGYYTVQVSGYNGASSTQPVVLRVHYLAPPAEPACAANSLPFAGQGLPAPLPVTLPAGTNTLIVFPQRRFGDVYGAAAATTVRSKLDLLAAQSGLGVTGAVLPVDSDPAVAAAFAGFDASPCNPETANEVVRATNAVVQRYFDSQPQLKTSVKYVVLAGADNVLPMGRVRDFTSQANEATDADALTDSSGLDTPISGAQRQGMMLTDDPFGDRDPVPWRDQVLYVPDLAVGRLVETPAQLSAAVDRFIAAGGALGAASSLTTGYDFLADGARAVDQALAARIAAANRALLVNETWSRSDVLAALFPGGGKASPGVAAVNGHYDHTRSLPALGNSTGDESDLFTTADVAANPGRLPGRILFSMGCHAGLSVPDQYVTSLDWAQAYAEQGAIWVANTGYGYGDSASVALSEQVMALFAKGLDGTMRVGQALAFAKQEYFAQIGVYDDYDQKAMMEATFFGLPMYSVGTAVAPPPPPAPLPIASDPSVGGLATASFTATPAFTTVGDPGGTLHLEADGFAPEITVKRPIQPRTERDVTQPATTAHGALITSLVSSDTLLKVTFARPVIDLKSIEPAASYDAPFPAALQNVTTYNSLTGSRQRVVLVPGQWVPDADPATPVGYGIQRRFTQLGVKVIYAPACGDFRQPQINQVGASIQGGTVSFTVTATDPGGTGVIKVLVLYLDDSGTWKSADLTSGGGGLWTGSGPATGTVAYFVQAVDACGNVGVSSNKTDLFRVGDGSVTGTPLVSAGPDVAVPTGGTYRAVGSFSDPDSSAWTATVDYGRGAGPVPLALAANHTFVLEQTYPSAGTFAVTVKVCDDAGHCGTDKATVSVSAAKKAVPVRECLWDNGNGTSTAWFGWSNPNPFPITVPIGADNRFDPDPQFRGQPTTLQAGRVTYAFSVVYPRPGNLVWKLQGTSSSSESTSPPCKR